MRSSGIIHVDPKSNNKCQEAKLLHIESPNWLLSVILELGNTSLYKIEYSDELGRAVWLCRARSKLIIFKVAVLGLNQWGHSYYIDLGW